MLRQAHQQTFESIKIDFRVFVANLELLSNLVVEILEQLSPRLAHRFVDLEAQFELKLIERGLDLVRLAALLIDRADALLEIDAGLNRPENLVARAEHAFEEFEFLREQLIDAFVRFVLAVEEVDDHDVVLLAITMAAPDALFNALGIPGQVVIDDERTELEIDAFRASLGRDHDPAFVAEIVHQAPTAYPRCASR